MIIEYAMNNSDEAEFSPYALTVSGTLTEIGNGYILIDDTVLCKNAEDGTIYTWKDGNIISKEYTDQEDSAEYEYYTEYEPDGKKNNNENNL